MEHRWKNFLATWGLEPGSPVSVNRHAMLSTIIHPQWWFLYFWVSRWKCMVLSVPLKMYGFESPFQQMYGFESPFQQMYGFESPFQQMYGFESPFQQMYGFESPFQQMHAFSWHCHAFLPWGVHAFCRGCARFCAAGCASALPLPSWQGPL